MAKTKREYILATCFLSGVAAAISFVSLGTQEWVIANPKESATNYEGGKVRIGLFYGLFNQYTGVVSQFELTTVCAFDINVCALMCGDNMVDNLRKYYYNFEVDQDACIATVLGRSNYHDQRYFIDKGIQANPGVAEDRRFINAGIWICTIMFLILSGIIGLFAAALSVWNTASSPYQVYFSIFGLYIYNGLALFFVLLPTVMYAGMYIKDIKHMVPFYNALKLDFVTDGEAQLGYSFWINLISIVFYIASIALLYIRNYLISKEPSQKLELEESGNAVIYLY